MRGERGDKRGELHIMTDKYKPTEQERKLLLALTDPANYTLNISELCSTAGICRDTYYRAMRKPEFVDYYNEAMMEALKANIQNVIKATYNFATTDVKNHQDRRLLLEMAGSYAAKTKTEVTTPEGLAAALTVTFAKSDDE